MFKSRTITISLRFYVSFALAAMLGRLRGRRHQPARHDHRPGHRPARPRLEGRRRQPPRLHAARRRGARHRLWSARCSPRSATRTPPHRRRPPRSRSSRSPGRRSAPTTGRSSPRSAWPRCSSGWPSPAAGWRWRPPSCWARSVVVWTIRAWAERATGDDRANLEIYRQVVEPIRLPIGALLLVGRHDRRLLPGAAHAAQHATARPRCSASSAR